MRIQLVGAVRVVPTIYISHRTQGPPFTPHICTHARVMTDSSDTSTVASIYATDYVILASFCTSRMTVHASARGLTHTSLLGLLYYDYILTLPNEIRVIWSASLNLANVLCLCVRYNFLVQITLTFFHNFYFTKGAGPDLSTQTCRTITHFLAIFNVVNFSFVSGKEYRPFLIRSDHVDFASTVAFVAMRMFAIYGRNWRLGILVFVLGCLSPCSIPLVCTHTLVVTPRR